MTTTQRTHHLTADRVHAFWDNSWPALIEIDSGDTVVFETRDASDGQMQPPATTAVYETYDRTRVHPLTGPVLVRGAEPGDTLEVEVLELVTGAWGYTSFRRGAGLLSEDFAGPYLHHWDLTSDPVAYLRGVHIPKEPFLGVMGVAPTEAGRLNTMPPRRNAGNVDVKQLTAGSKLYLPVLFPGALFSCGDGHAAQGDGEVCVTAIECEMTATLRFHLHKGRALQEFQFETRGPLAPRTNTAGWYATTGHGPDLTEAARNAVRHMIAHLCDRHGFTPDEAYVLCSVAVDLKISEIVDAPNWIVSAFLPKSIFA
ncbi:MAG: acetamidase/formamidase family protein [Dehalococcoidia bacterium]